MTPQSDTLTRTSVGLPKTDSPWWTWFHVLAALIPTMSHVLLCYYQYNRERTHTKLTTRPCLAVLNAWLSSAARRRRLSFNVSSSLRTAIGTASSPVPPGCSATVYDTQLQLSIWLKTNLPYNHNHLIIQKSWPQHQLLSAHKYTVVYYIVSVSSWHDGRCVKI